ncbi:MAG: alanine racemase [Bacteroidia bacterium]|nr:alanine racemase [Bacteroidia bacterium]
MIGIPYSIDTLAVMASAIDLFQGLYPPSPINYIAFDTRFISHGSQTIFVAIRTGNRDGHDFIKEAWEKGVRNFMVEKPVSIPGINYVLCESTVKSLQHWAQLHRQKFDYPVIGITGSNGKTTVKEWLATLLEMQFQLVKSPMSYNSQLGVPLSVLQLRPHVDMAIIEAGISRTGEMEVLEKIIQPTIGILTHMGVAHAEGFESFNQKLSEKVRLFSHSKAVLIGSQQPEVTALLKEYNLPVFPAAENLSSEFNLPLKGAEEKENALLAIHAARFLGLSTEEISRRISLLHPVSMRMEMITDNPEITLINDSYNSDLDSVRSAFRRLIQTRVQPGNQIIISDIPHQGDLQQEVQRQVLEEAINLVGKDHVRTVGPVFARLGHPLSYVSTESLMENIRYEDFRNCTVLLKGARDFALEKVIPLLNRKLNATYFKINLQALSHNFRLLKSLIPEGTRTMCMVKAASYGSGTWEIAQALANEGADYLTVAYASEGIELRNARIDLPIMVMNPDVSSIEALINFDIEPEISNRDFLEKYVKASRLAGITAIRLHLKLETGMGRLGFIEDELDELIAFIRQYPDLTIVSVMSHLAAADQPSEDIFTQTQISTFLRMDRKLREELGIAPMRHILNTAGVIRFPAYSMEMVRLGIGLYGVSSGEGKKLPFQEIGSLFSVISQIHTWPEGTSIGYGRAEFTQRESRIATIPIGYADGIPRSLSNGKTAFRVRGKQAPIFGRVCMDMLMLDVTDIPEAAAGDEVLIFGRQGSSFVSVTEIAEAAGTIPYEILVRISPRVRRIYVREDW